ncbi:MAG: hypothetical protein P8R54_21560 [Myxococcota bacterium]|nr:hypothetical protein [Myxococcota bacterium]
MSRVALSIELESASVLGGDMLCGVVVVVVSEPVRCDGIRLDLGWHTAGQGESDAAVVVSVELPGGDWPAGTSRQPLQLVVPHGPLSHCGALIEIAWTLTATAALADGTAAATQGLILKPGLLSAAPAPAVPQMPAVTAQQRPPGRLLARLLPTFLGVGLALLGVIVVLAGIAVIVAAGPAGLAVGVLGLGMIVGGSRMALRASGNAVARRKIKDIQLQIVPRSLRPGQEFRVAVDFRPAQDTSVREVRLRLILRELATAGVGAHRTTQTIEKVYASAQICGARDFAAEERFSAVHMLALPPDAPHSFSARSNRLLWLVQLDIDIDDWPDLTEPHPILVS